MEQFLSSRRLKALHPRSSQAKREEGRREEQESETTLGPPPGPLGLGTNKDLPRSFSLCHASPTPPFSRSWVHQQAEPTPAFSPLSSRSFLAPPPPPRALLPGLPSSSIPRSSTGSSPFLAAQANVLSITSSLTICPNSRIMRSFPSFICRHYDCCHCSLTIPKWWLEPALPV